MQMLEINMEFCCSEVAPFSHWVPPQGILHQTQFRNFCCLTSKPGAHLFCQTRPLPRQEDWSCISFPFARALGVSISLCLMSQTCSLVPLRRNDCAAWGNPASLGVPASATGVALPFLHPLSLGPCRCHLKPVAQHLLRAGCQGGKGFAWCQKKSLVFADI